MSSNGGFNMSLNSLLSFAACQPANIKNASKKRNQTMVSGSRSLSIILSTIANKSGTNFMTCLENLESEIEEEVSFILYEGEKTGRPSTLVDLTGDDAVITKR